MMGERRCEHGRKSVTAGGGHAKRQLYRQRCRRPYMYSTGRPKRPTSVPTTCGRPCTQKSHGAFGRVQTAAAVPAATHSPQVEHHCSPPTKAPHRDACKRMQDRLILAPRRGNPLEPYENWRTCSGAAKHRRATGVGGVEGGVGGVRGVSVTREGQEHVLR